MGYKNKFGNRSL